MNHPQNGRPERAPKIFWTKRVRKAAYRGIANIRDGIADRSPPWLKERFSPVYDYLDMFLADHGIFRVLYTNRYLVAPGVWRSSQPWPHQVRYYAKHKNIKTIVNLRGVNHWGSYRLEERACKDYGVTLRNDLKVHSRGAPTKEVILGMRDFFEELEYPILLHCKSGADRAGLVSTLYQHIMQDVPIEKARSQLSLRFGHVKQAKTGMLDFFFEQYLDYAKDHDIAFLDWVETVYDEDELIRSFHSGRWSNILVDKVLRRE